MSEALVSFSVPFDTTILAGRVGDSTIKMYERDFKAYLDFATTPEHAFETVTLARWITYLANETTKSPNTINRMVSAVKKIMKEAAIQGYIPHETADAFEHVSGVTLKALKGRLRQHNRVRIEPEMIRTITESFDTTTLIGLRNRAMFTTLASSGLRIKELVTLTRDQIIRHPQGYLLTIHAVQGKNLIEDRDTNISVEAVEAIDAWLAKRPVESLYIFTSFKTRGDSRPDIKHISPVGAWKIVRRVFHNHGMLHVKPHDLRRFLGTQLAKQDIEMARLALGHKRIETTVQNYVLSKIEPGVTDHLF